MRSIGIEASVAQETAVHVMYGIVLIDEDKVCARFYFIFSLFFI